MYNITSKVALVIVILLFTFSVYAQDIDQKQFIENEAYVVHVSMESGMFKITVKNKKTLHTSEYKQMAVLVDNVQNILFLGQNSFLVEGSFGVGAALFLATIMDNDAIKPNAEIRVGSYFISPNKATLIFSNWNPVPSKGPIYLYTVDLNSDYSATRNDLMILDNIKGKIIFETKDHQHVAKNALILSHDLTWADGGQRILFLCEELISNPCHYLFEYNFNTGKSNMIAKLDKHNSRSTIEAFQWDDKRKVVEISYAGIGSKKHYKYIINSSGKMKYHELPAQIENK